MFLTCTSSVAAVFAVMSPPQSLLSRAIGNRPRVWAVRHAGG